MKSILITGGTGFIGKPLCEQLLTNGYRLYVLTRKKNLNPQKENVPINYIHTLDVVQHVDIDIIINLAGEPIAQRWTENIKKEIYDSRILTTQKLVNLIQNKEKKPTLLISGSAVGFYGTDFKVIFDEENSPANNNSEFSRYVCQSWENEALKAELLGIRTVLLRIGPVLEKDGGMLSKLLPSFYLGLGGQIGHGKQWLSWIDRDDLIRLILFIIDDEKINGPINATSLNPVTNNEFSKSLAKSLKRPCFLKIPDCFLKFGFGQMADEMMLKGQKVLPTKALQYGFEFLYPTLMQSLEKILKVTKE